MAAAIEPATALVAAASEDLLHAGVAWRKSLAYKSLKAAQLADPGVGAVQQAEAEVEAAYGFNPQLWGLCGTATEGLL